MDTAVNLMEEMAVMGLYPDLITYVGMIKGLCAFERLEEARRLFDEMSCRGYFPNNVVYSALIDGACHAGNLDMAMELRAIEAVKILDHMSSEGCAPNWVTVSNLIDGLIAEGHNIWEAEKVVKKLLENGVQPSGLAISSLIREFCLIKRSIDAYGCLFELVKDDRLLTIDSDLHSVVLAGLLEEGCSGERSLSQ
ncbi:pentatricopeptide repeat-containing protein At5g47360-like [Aristolochia californica]|uniref:pentatricopeptide repeat-containing protein At5g47360-like n=1 Tax=Aristolochia californica TaxID=171875 RepID=UPI0035DFD406